MTDRENTDETSVPIRPGYCVEYKKSNPPGRNGFVWRVTEETYDIVLVGNTWMREPLQFYRPIEVLKDKFDESFTLLPPQRYFDYETCGDDAGTPEKLRPARALISSRVWENDVWAAEMREGEWLVYRNNLVMTGVLGGSDGSWAYERKMTSDEWLDLQSRIEKIDFWNVWHDDRMNELDSPFYTLEVRVGTKRHCVYRQYEGNEIEAVCRRMSELADISEMNRLSRH